MSGSDPNDTPGSKTWSQLDELAPRSKSSSALPRRYESRGVLGRGGMGIVWRVFDHTLQREVALKTLRPELSANANALGRFTDEAHTIARLQHPGVIPIFDRGTLSDGRPYYAMQVVEGDTLTQRIASTPASGRRRLIAHSIEIARTIGFAHTAGVVHRDLKPDNVLLGPHGEVFVVDWGLAKGSSGSEAFIPGRTVAGRAIGTPRYMSPEAGSGQLARIGPPSDVYALGLLLYECVLGVSARGEVTRESLDEDIRHTPVSVGQSALPEALRTLVLACVEEKPELRPTAVTFANRLEDWLVGLRRREEATELLQEAHRLQHQADSGARRAAELESEAAANLDRIPTWAAEREKRNAWATLDEAERLQVRANTLEAEAMQQVHAALYRDPDHPEARSTLARLWRARVEHAEHHGDTAEAAVAERVLRKVDPGEHAHFLAGTGAVTLHTHPAGLEVTAWRIETVERRLRRVDSVHLGATPLDAAPLDRGSWELELQLAGETMIYPVHLGRNEHWNGLGPASEAPVVVPWVHTPQCYVPTGWTSAGCRDFDIPVHREWVHGFVIHQLPITLGHYVEFLEDLIRQGRGEEVMEVFAPRERGPTPGSTGPLILPYENGRFSTDAHVREQQFHPQQAATMVPVRAARAFATWHAGRTGLPWRLPTLIEWEKAARGVDGRVLPWGEHHDGAWADTRPSYQGPLLRRQVGRFPIDRSVYGVMDMAGGVGDWVEGTAIRAGGREGSTAMQPFKGGNYATHHPHLAFRPEAPATYRGLALGFRLARSLTPEEEQRR